MPIAEQLRAAGLFVFPCWVRRDDNKNRWDKGPAVPKGESWKLTSYRPVNDPALDWSSGVVGVPIPARVLVLDVDTYKGATREAVEAYLGCSLPWGRAFIQRTIGGGEHYAFKCDWDARQLQNDGLKGLDTRAAGKGFICSGNGYTPVGFGVFAMAHPDTLPEIPDAARSVLEVVPVPPAPPGPLPEHTTDDDQQVIEALHHIDPGCDRAEWVRIGLALRHQYHDEPDTGLDIFDRWSAGEYWAGGTPENYVPEHVPNQWGSFKPEGGTTIATLFYRALQSGWTPPATFDTASAFGPGAAPAAVFDGLVERVQESGGDVKQTATIVEEIKAAGCNALQVALLAAELKNALKDAGIKDKAVVEHIDALLRTRLPSAPDQPGVYGKNDTDNAAIFLDKHYPDGTLIKCDGELYAYTGKVWEKTSIDTLKHRVAVDMSQLRMQTSRINSCIDLVSKLVPVYDGTINRLADRRIIFNNGVLDIDSGRLDPHSKYYYSTILLPYDYDPQAQAPHWLQFLNDTLENDQERIEMLQEWLGYLLINDYRHHKVLLLLGPKRCGKGTIGRIIQHLVGDPNFSGGSLSSFARDSFIDSLRTRPVLFIGDAAKKVPSSVVNQVIERIKSISGNDAVDFDRKYLSGLSETLPTRITIAANGVPNLFDDSGALASRIMLLPFYRSYFGQEDLGLIDRLLPELPGIAAWALEGLRRLLQNGRFIEPAASLEELEQLRESYSPLVQFLNECCITGEAAECTASDLYAAYRAWCVNGSEDLLRPKVFISAIKDATRGQGVKYGPHRFTDGTIGRGFKGIAPRGEVPATAAAFKVVK